MISLQRSLLRQDFNFQKKRAAIFLQEGGHGIKASENPYRFSEAFLKNGLRFFGLFYPENRMEMYNQGKKQDTKAGREKEEMR